MQIAGALAILIAFAAVQLGHWRADGRAYLVLNLVGSAILAYLALIEEQWGFVLLETVWAVVSLWSLVRVARGLPVGAAH